MCQHGDTCPALRRLMAWYMATRARRLYDRWVEDGRPL